ncbi:hypothetical protein J2R99_000978 [Rhodopseudomonas julia]|uniref:Uncharacterized protein n=1 Tax=Rhodopseudomonas julia TaxID=200617 RepID=A0ABU0C3Q2_9BRAD|nr:hypothetical protein [Rhodopseudomonas julia]MDQ0325129.1 hypothetical protein [Rhodopseudomonas julia]
MAEFPDEDWMAAFAERVASDRELAVIGSKFDVDMGITFGTKRYVLRVRQGRIDKILQAPGFDVPTQFEIRAPMELWQRFLCETPPPLYHDIFAMIMRVPEFVLEGDTLVAMQNARALHRMMGLMQKVGKEHA